MGCQAVLQTQGSGSRLDNMLRILQVFKRTMLPAPAQLCPLGQAASSFLKTILKDTRSSSLLNSPVPGCPPGSPSQPAFVSSSWKPTPAPTRGHRAQREHAPHPPSVPFCLLGPKATCIPVQTNVINTSCVSDTQHSPSRSSQNGDATAVRVTKTPR